MQYHVKKFTLFLPLLMLLCLAAAPRVEAQQRLERPPAREVEGTPILAAGSQTVPEGTFLILEMENRLTSETSRQSDRFRARVASPVVDANGRVLIPEAAYVEGHVSNVTPARWRRRSGIIAIDFDNLYLPNGKRYPIRGYLTSADPDDRKRIDDEGNIKGKAPTKRDSVFIGGGTGAGAAIGWIAGSTLAGAGIGAAVGLTATLLMKGQEAIVEEGQRIAIGLTEDLKVGASPQAPKPSIGGGPIPGFGGQTGIGGGGTTMTASGAVNLSSVRAERNADGLLRILITAETPTAGWRIFTNHEISRDTVDIRLRGVAPSALAPRQLSHPTAPTIVIPDRNGRIQKIVVHAKNVVRSINVNSSWTEQTGGDWTSPSNPPPSKPPSQPSTPPTTTPPSSGGGSDASLNETASRIEKDIDLIRYNFASSIGVWLNKDGSYDVLTGRRPTVEEKKFLDGLGALSNSVKGLPFNSATASARRSTAMRIEEDAQVVEEAWRRISMSSEANQQVRDMLGRVRNLVDRAIR